MEVDHIFICVTPGAPEAEVLTEFGLTQGSSNLHPGQGTANRRFFFHNAFLELLWLDDAVEAQSEITNPTMLYRRLTATDDGASPFGVCFRPQAAAEEEAPFPSWRYKPGYLPTPLCIDIGNAPIGEPMWFFLSFGSRPDKATADQRQPLNHATKLLELTSLRLTIPENGGLSAPACRAAETHGVEIVEGEAHLLEMGFDQGSGGHLHEFRPVLPLVFKW